MCKAVVLNICDLPRDIITLIIRQLSNYKYLFVYFVCSFVRLRSFYVSILLRETFVNYELILIHNI